MKKVKYGILLSLITIGTSAFAFSGADIPGGAMNQIMGAGGATQIHEMQMIKDMNFRYQEYNDYKDLKEQKEAKNKEFELTEPAMKRIYNQQPKQNVQFVEQNGQLKIRSIE